MRRTFPIFRCMKQKKLIYIILVIFIFAKITFIKASEKHENNQFRKDDFTKAKQKCSKVNGILEHGQNAHFISSSKGKIVKNKNKKIEIKSDKKEEVLLKNQSEKNFIYKNVKKEKKPQNIITILPTTEEAKKKINNPLKRKRKRENDPHEEIHANKNRKIEQKAKTIKIKTIASKINTNEMITKESVTKEGVVNETITNESITNETIENKKIMNQYVIFIYNGNKENGLDNFLEMIKKRKVKKEANDFFHSIISNIKCFRLGYKCNILPREEYIGGIVCNEKDPLPDHSYSNKYENLGQALDMLYKESRIDTELTSMNILFSSSKFLNDFAYNQFSVYNDSNSLSKSTYYKVQLFVHLFGDTFYSLEKCSDTKHIMESIEFHKLSMSVLFLLSSKRIAQEKTYIRTKIYRKICMEKYNDIDEDKFLKLIKFPCFFTHALEFKPGSNNIQLIWTIVKKTVFHNMENPLEPNSYFYEMITKLHEMSCEFKKEFSLLRIDICNIKALGHTTILNNNKYEVGTIENHIRNCLKQIEIFKIELKEKISKICPNDMDLINFIYFNFGSIILRRVLINLSDMENNTTINTFLKFLNVFNNKFLRANDLLNLSKQEHVTDYRYLEMQGLLCYIILYSFLHFNYSISLELLHRLESIKKIVSFYLENKVELDMNNLDILIDLCHDTNEIASLFTEVNKMILERIQFMKKMFKILDVGELINKKVHIVLNNLEDIQEYYGIIENYRELKSSNHVSKKNGHSKREEYKSSIVYYNYNLFLEIVDMYKELSQMIPILFPK